MEMNGVRNLPKRKESRECPANLGNVAPDDAASGFSYASSRDSWWTQTLIRTVESLAGSRRLQRLYDQLRQEGHSTSELWGTALARLQIDLDYTQDQMELIPRTGPLVIIANHPFGILDGLVLCYLTSRLRNDFFALVNESVLPQPLVAEHLLPIDFHPTKAALRTNLATKRETSQRLRNGRSMIIFPAGMVATSARPWGPAVEQPWSSFVCRRIHEGKCTVVPIYFHGQNSRLFHLASRVNVSVRLGLLLHELSNRIGSTVRVEIGDPIPYSTLAPFRGNSTMIDFLRRQTLDLANLADQTPNRPTLANPLRRMRHRISKKKRTGGWSVSP